MYTEKSERERENKCSMEIAEGGQKYIEHESRVVYVKIISSISSLSGWVLKKFIFVHFIAAAAAAAARQWITRRFLTHS